MDMLEYNARIFNLFYTAMQPPATPESLTEQEEDREPEDPLEDLGRCVEIMRGERVA